MPFCKLSSLILNRPLSESLVFPMVFQHFQQVVKLSSVGEQTHRAPNCKCKSEDAGRLARAQAGAGVGPAGHTFWHGNVHFPLVFKGYLRHPLGDAKSLVLQANLVIRVWIFQVICHITVNHLICAHTMVGAHGTPQH